jgi:TonB family protein
MNGQLSDLHLSELIEFFCNQRKTGRLKIDYPLAPGVFFIKEGELVDAKVGALNGKDAVFFALTLASATFDFNPGMGSSRRTINESWASVVLEGLRRIDEGAMPDFDVFNGEGDLDEATREYLECVEESKASKAAATPQAEARSVAENASPLSMTVDATNNTGGRSKAMIAGVAAALVLVCAVAAIPISRKLMRKDAPAATPQAAAAPATQAEAPVANDAANAPLQVNASDVVAAEDAAAVARREQQQREARERARKAREEAAKNAAQDQTLTATTPKPATPAGAKTVRVQITYDEAGRVTQASAIGTSPGAEAYASTAVRVARSRHFAPGKPGSTVVTIPIN